MGVYRNICYKVENVFVKILTKKQNSEAIEDKVINYRLKKVEEKIAKKIAKKKVAQQKNVEFEKLRDLKKQQEQKEIYSLLSKVVDVKGMDYTNYEFGEVKANKQFFQKLVDSVFESDEYVLTFLSCEFDKSSKTEIKGYLIVTNKRVWFVNKSFEFQQKFRYQTIKNVQWFRDGILEKGLKIQYGARKLEFDEIFDKEQMNRVGNLILQKSANQ
ncbi:PH domain-containing protein [Metabacillus rhizolycopersici]|uniref:PH domain-containing protein n=1 Tax=Metabacillus rhizolycopersici TaxID=2875709 RepID=A0ABS7UTE3_9BACI|nr:PH domain-containing protein [Metabacillus rhizolycopersici]MBZ5751347.1 PH domain-containing protein [Metabacillus rhizolycopersici]